MTDNCCFCLGFWALLVGCVATSVWLISLHRRVDRQVDHILSSLRSIHCDSRLQDDVEYTTGRALSQMANVTSPVVCRLKCKQNSKCAAWTWGAARGVEGLTDVCSLRELELGQMPKVHERPGVVSGLACQEAEDEARASRLRGAAAALEADLLGGVEEDDGPADFVAARRSALLVSSSRRAPPGGGGLQEAGALAAAAEPAAAEGEGKAAAGAVISTATSTKPKKATHTTVAVSTTPAAPATPAAAGGAGNLPAAVAEQTLFCFSLMLPGGYEQVLLHMQHQETASIFACDGYAVYSNSSIEVSSGVVTKVVNSDLHAELGGEFNTAMNTAIFMVVWDKVSKDGVFSKFAWTVKADPDTVFFPARLRPVLVGHREAEQYKKAARDAHGSVVDALRCDVWGDVGDGSCADTFQWSGGEKSLRECSAECSRFANCKGVAWSESEGCVLLGALADRPGGNPGWQQYEKVPQKGVYINNCKYGLHGPLEIFSAAAVKELVKGQEKCRRHFTRGCGGECAWGEDLFVDQCLWKVLGVQRDDMLDLLLETHCDPPERWEDCTATNQVAFHPFKNAEDYQICMDNALSRDLLAQAHALT